MIWSNIEADREKLFEKYSMNRPENWRCDSRTRDTICIMAWFAEELKTVQGLSHEQRMNQQYYLNRMSRGCQQTDGNWDLFELVTSIMNETIEGKLYIPNPRWRRH